MGGKKEFPPTIGPRLLRHPDYIECANDNIAAEQTGRKAFLMELDAPHCDVIVERWEKFTGRKAKRQPAATPVEVAQAGT